MRFSKYCRLFLFCLVLSGCSSIVEYDDTPGSYSIKSQEPDALHKYEACLKRYMIACGECEYFLRYETDYLEKDILMKKCLSNMGFPYAADTCEKFRYSSGDK